MTYSSPAVEPIKATRQRKVTTAQLKAALVGGFPANVLGSLKTDDLVVGVAATAGPARPTVTASMDGPDCWVLRCDAETLEELVRLEKLPAETSRGARQTSTEISFS